MDDETAQGPAREIDDDGQGPSNADIARAALIQAAITISVALALNVAIAMAIANRDAIARTLRRFTTQRRTAQQVRETCAINEFRREVTEISHALGTVTDDG